ncbi:sialin-like isoform X2 [Portunus trituberculatus]|uniref:sialin-like isoform X2 n=1 Tax=Portunus trituberculatus TaxID=210409 RepID=UPI001E1CE855|nr:sialin-like isoform X2 [Portunus trituberculatus]
MCRGWRDQVEDGAGGGGGAAIPEDLTQPRARWVCLVPIRYMVVVLGLLGCMLDYLMRFGLSVAIIAMTNSTRPVSQNFTPDHACPAAVNGSDDIYPVGTGDFAWTVKEQGIILGTFFWGYFFTKTIGGRISELMGARETMAVSIWVSGVLCLLTPTMAAIHPLALATLRFAMGIMQGPAFPSLYCVLARWAPPEKLATMTTIAFSGMSLGSVIAMGSSQWVVDHLGWQWVFWGAGILGLIWTPFWIYFVRNSPCSHPLMSLQEQELLAPNLAIKPKRNVPWSRLLRCWRFYPAILAEFASSWLANQTTNQGPSFLKAQVGFTMGEVSFVLTVGQTCCWVTAFTFGQLSDWLVQGVHLKKVNARRVIHLIAMVMIVLGLGSVVLAGCHKWVVSAMMMITMMGSSATLSSFTLTPMDIAPNYAGTLSGMLGIGNIGGFLAPIIAAEIVTQTGGWEASMLVCGAVYFLAGVLYLVTATADVQEWNDYEELPSSDEGE